MAMKILITDTQNRNAVALIRAFGKMGLTIYAGDCERISTGFFSRFVSGRTVYPDPIRNENRFLEHLLAFIQKEKIEIVFPIVEKTILAIAKNKYRFDRQTKLPIADYKTLLKAADKAYTFKIAHKIGIPIPKTYFPENVSDLGSINHFPVILKPRFSSGSRGLTFCKNKSELMNAFHANILKYNGVIVQEYIPTADQENCEFDWYGIYDWNSILKSHGCFRRLRTYPINSGPSTFKESVEHRQINEIAKKILDYLNWQGLVQLDFRIDSRDNIPKLMEINPRTWASIEHSIRIGMDVPRMWLNLALGNPIPKGPPIRTGIKSRWLLPGDILWFLSAKKNLNNIKAFFSFRGVDYELINKGDIKPIFGFLLAAFMYFIRKDKRHLIIRKRLKK